MKSYPQNNNYKPGTWKGVKSNDSLKRTAAFTCPKCGNACSLINHTIHSDGKVSPSLVCPHDCDFHEFIKLEGWQEGDNNGI